uniref:Uncharacterized protein n=1 Tax=Siphoviridae sp. ctsMn4 TaxID=2826485 RepID=A0A8S5NJ42_9CAUD|nr:MAG TPA: hypothetical protein [Siphoviridae sp. ctsMn4]
MPFSKDKIFSSISSPRFLLVFVIAKNRQNQSRKR